MKIASRMGFTLHPHVDSACLLSKPADCEGQYHWP
jgi:hypothetical protein